MTGRAVRVRVVVRGLVQGVWFRESCRRRASELGVDGWVRNRSDGAVEAVMSGGEAAVAQLVAWCREGPPRADVTGVDVVDESAPEGELLVGFRVR